MRIGEFAKECKTKISVLRHYDKLGLLCPVYIDKFTDYRYYDDSQIALFNQIKNLQSAGFSLADIKLMLTKDNGEMDISSLIAKKRAELNETLQNLEIIEKIMLGEGLMNTNTKLEAYNEDVNLPFENDEQVTGKWEIVSDENEIPTKEIYFLTGGEWYWCYSWTKGKLLYKDGYNSFANDYTLKKQNGELFMYVKFKSYDYIKSGKINVIVLRKVDSKHYTREDIARKDNIDMPFVNDERVIGKWAAYDFIPKKSDFNAKQPIANFDLYFKSIEFAPNGSCTSVYGDEIITGDDMQVWTKGYVLCKWNKTACAYEIKIVSGKEYLIIEWKSGDYRFGGRDTNYYVFTREC